MSRFFLCLSGEGGYTEVSREDVEALASLPLCAHPKGYVSTRVGGRKSPTLLLHRVVAARAGTLSPGLQVDHVNRDKRDNRRENLRLVTQSQNLQNATKARSRSRSGIRGVSLNARGNRWVATVTPAGQKRIRLGEYKTIEEAIAARLAGVVKYHTHAPKEVVDGI